MMNKYYISHFSKINLADVQKEYRKLELNYTKFFKMDNFSKMGYLAAANIFNQIDQPNIRSEIGLIIGTSSSSIQTDLSFQKSIQKHDNYFPSPSIFVYTLPNIVLGEIALAFKIYGENTCIIAEKIETFELENIIEQIFTQTTTKQILCGWIEEGKTEQSASLMLVNKEINKHEYSNKQLLKLFYHGRVD